MTVRRVIFKKARPDRPARPGIFLLSLFLTAACLGVASVGARLRVSSAGAVEKSKPGSPVESSTRGGVAHFNEGYGKLPLSFEANRGQFARGVNFAARGNGHGIYLKPAEIVLAVRRDARVSEDDSTTSAVVSMRLINASAGASAEGLEETPAKVNYLVGNDPRRWRTGVHTYAKVRYRNTYPGVDDVYYGNQRQLEYDFVVAPGADPRRIRLAIKGASAVGVDADGGLVLGTAAGDVRQPKPLAFQEAGGARREVAVGYKGEGLRGELRAGRVRPCTAARH